jgi:hypothetical protein
MISITAAYTHTPPTHTRTFTRSHTPPHNTLHTHIHTLRTHCPHIRTSFTHSPAATHCPHTPPHSPHTRTAFTHCHPLRTHSPPHTHAQRQHSFTLRLSLCASCRDSRCDPQCAVPTTARTNTPTAGRPGPHPVQVQPHLHGTVLYCAVQIQRAVTGTLTLLFTLTLTLSEASSSTHAHTCTTQYSHTHAHAHCTILLWRGQCDDMSDASVSVGSDGALAR